MSEAPRESPFWPGHRGPAWREWLPLALFFVLSLPAVTTRIYASDEINYFVYLRSLWFDRDLSFENEYRHFYDRGVARSPGFRETFLERTTETGRRISFGTIGCAMLWAPFYAAADVAVRVLRAAGHPVEADGFSRPYVAAVCYGSALYGFGAVLISALVARRLVGAGALAAVVVWLGTPLLFYMYVAPPMAHASSAFCVSLFVLTWLVVRERWTRGGFMTLGAVGALMVMVREQDLFFVAGPALDFAWTLGQRLRSRSPSGQTPSLALVVNMLAGLATFAAVFLPQAISYLVLNSRLGPSRLVTRKMTWTAPHALEVLASPHHGFLVWTPLACLGIAGLVLLTWRAPKPGPRGPDVSRLALCALVMIASQVYVAGSLESWTVAGAFGQRRFVGSTILLTLGLAALMRAARSRAARVPLTLAVLASVWWNLGLMAQFGSGLMDRQRLEPARNAYNTFLVVPRRLPELAYRYLFERQSFYRGPGKD